MPGVAMNVMDELRQALTHPNVQAFLTLIRTGEGTLGDEDYGRFFSPRKHPEYFDDFSDHPRKRNRHRMGERYIISSAAGAYQIIEPTWDMIQRNLSLPDFTPESQDLAAVWLIRHRGALSAVIAGDLETAIKRCAREWASLPGSPYGQPLLSAMAAKQAYVYAGGRIA